jgi:hypothetical protein
VFGREQEQLARECTRSINDRKSFASYHFAEVKRLTKAFEGRHLAGARTLLQIHTRGAEKKRAAFEHYMIKVGAHAIAAVQSIHAIPDIVAHAIYFAAGQNLQPNALLERNIALPGVARILKKDHSFCSLSKPLQALQSGDGWSHLSAVSNIGKHRNVVRSALSEDWSGKRASFRELHISSFRHDGVSYASKSLQGLLEPEYNRLVTAIVALGHELNGCLRKIAA